MTKPKKSPSDQQALITPQDREDAQERLERRQRDMDLRLRHVFVTGMLRAKCAELVVDPRKPNENARHLTDKTEIDGKTITDKDIAEVIKLEAERDAIDNELAESKSKIRGPVWRRARWFTRITKGELDGGALRKWKGCVQRQPFGVRTGPKAGGQPKEWEYEVYSVIAVAKPEVAKVIREALTS